MISNSNRLAENNVKKINYNECLPPQADVFGNSVLDEMKKEIGRSFEKIDDPRQL